jgi:transketolase
MSSLATRIRQIILQQSMRAHVGHIGSALSIADLLAALYGEVLEVPAADDPERDRLVLSKGHAVLALYAALCATGRLREAELETFCGDGSLLGGHPEPGLDYIDFATGSLGHGLSIGAGAALAARLDGASRRTFVLMSDAECNEGSVWEAVMFAAHHRLANLTAIIDVNGQQALNYTRDVMDLEPLGELETRDGPPHVLLARTTFGKGVSFMESKIEWHYWPMNGQQYADAMRELEGVEV